MVEARSISVLLSANVSGYIAAMSRAGHATEAAMGKASRATSLHNKALSLAGTAAKGAGLAVAGGLALAVKEAADFNEKMALVQTLSHANAQQMRELSSSAKFAGQQFGYTATEVADGQAEMIKAGVSLKDIMGGGLRGTLALAAAGQTDVATATEIAASALTQFNLKGRDVPHVADLLAAGADKALGSVTDLGYGLSQVGTTAHQMNIPIEATVGTLAEFAQAGLTGERGGTTFKQMLLQLAAPSKQAAELMQFYNLSLYKANGQMKTMPEIADNLQRSFKGISPEARNAALGVIFGSRAIQGANILLKDGAAGNRKWIRSVNDQGFAAHQASGKLNSLKGDLQKLKSTAETGLIELGSGAQSPLRGLAQGLTKDIARVTKNGDLQRWGNEVGHVLDEIVQKAGPLAHQVGGALQTVGTGIGHIVDGFNKLPSGLQHAIVTGGLVAVLGKKLGLGSVLTAATKSTGLGGARGGVTPVFVTNWGKGRPGGLPSGPGKPGAPVVRTQSLALTAVEAVAAGIAIGGLNDQLARLGGRGSRGGVLSDFIKSKSGLSTFLFGSGHTLQHDLQDAFKGKNGPGGGAGLKAEQWLSGLTGVDSTLTKSVKNVDSLDKALAHLNYAKPAQGAKAYKKVLAESGLTAAQLATVLPRTSAAMAAMAARTANTAAASRALAGDVFGAVQQFHRSGLSVQQYGKFLRGLPKAARIAISTPGMLQSASQVRGLGKALHLTPKQIRILLKMLGFDKVKNDTNKTRRALDDIDGKTAKPKVSVDDKATPRVRNIHRTLQDLHHEDAKPSVTLQDKKARKQTADLRHLLTGPLGHTIAKPTAALNDKATGPTKKAQGAINHFGASRPRAVISVHDAASAVVRAAEGILASFNGRHATSYIETVHVNRFVNQGNPSQAKPRGNQTATGGTFEGARGIGIPRIIGEAGPEAVVPLNRPLSQVDPSVRLLSAFAQGKLERMASGGHVGGADLLAALKRFLANKSAPEYLRDAARGAGINGGSRAVSHAAPKADVKAPTQVHKKPESIAHMFNLNAGMSVKAVDREFNQLAKRLHGLTPHLRGLEGAAKKVAHAYNEQEKQLKSLRSKSNQLNSSTTQSFMNDPFGNGLTGLGDVLQQDTYNAMNMATSLKRLKHKGISRGLEAALAASGDSATAMELAKLSRGQINRYDTLFAQRSKAANWAGDVASRTTYGHEIKRLTAELRRLSKHINGIEHAAERGTARGTAKGMNDRSRSSARKRRVSR